MSHHLTAGSLVEHPWSLALSPKRAGWDWSGLRVLDLPAGGSHTFETGEEEMVVLPLAGQGLGVRCDGEAFELEGRPGVFTGVTNFVYLPREAEVEVRSPAGARVAFPSARCKRRLTPRYGPAAQVPVERRGAGQCLRTVHNFCAADVFEADRLIAVEVLTPGGNWSSYPPHKHDEDRPGLECELEEIYYFVLGTGPQQQPGFGYQRVYGTPDRPIDVLAEVRSGDVVTIPHGWHGPSMAVPGYDMYYLNVMAGPGAVSNESGRTWLICDDPAHAWVRATWSQEGR